MSKYHKNRVDEYNIKQQKHKMYTEQLNVMVEKRNILYKQVKSVDKNDGTVESYVYNPRMIKVRSRFININSRIRSLKKKVKRTE